MTRQLEQQRLDQGSSSSSSRIHLPRLLRLHLLCRGAISITPRASHRLLQVPLLHIFGVVLDVLNIALLVILIQSDKTAVSLLRIVV